MELTDDQIAEGLEVWAGLDNAPGSRTWKEWELETGLSAEALRVAAASPDAAAVRTAMESGEFAGLAVDDPTELVIRIADVLWGRMLEKEFVVE